MNKNMQNYKYFYLQQCLGKSTFGYYRAKYYGEEMKNTIQFGA